MADHSALEAIKMGTLRRHLSTTRENIHYCEFNIDISTYLSSDTRPPEALGSHKIHDLVENENMGKLILYLENILVPALMHRYPYP
jgi:hypothetical protein